ncbi:MAG: DUF695 domain-containing protein [Bacteroidetes bacterium]|nr:DUF695 domain-containing protein [Bacteroidota bacterium]
METRTEWDFYFCTVEDKPASIMLNLALIQQAPMDGKADFVQISVNLKQPNEYGLSSQGEAEILYVIEDQLAEHLDHSLRGVYAGRSTTNNQRVFYFYCDSSIDYKNIVDEVMEGFSDYECSSLAQKDPEWTFYSQFLYPSKIEYQSILNRRVLENLTRYGDTLQQEREVEHFIYFPGAEEREHFVNKVKPEGFEVVDLNFDHSQAGFPFGLVISRKDKVDAKSVEETVLFLVLLATECKGEYDGWETCVVNAVAGEE